MRLMVVGKRPGDPSHVAKIGILNVLISGKTLCGLDATIMKRGEVYFMPNQVSCETCLKRLMQ